MFDLLMLALLVAAFAAAIGCVWVCVDLIGTPNGRRDDTP